MKVNTKLVTTLIAVGAVIVIGALTASYIIHKQNEKVMEVVVEEVLEVEDFPLVIEEEVIVEDETGEVEAYYYDYYYTPNYDYNTEDGVLTRSGGVNYYNGNRETWYSSNVLYHYRTGEWILGNDGVYRDSDGYVVVASSDLAQGDTVDTSLGMGKVYDSGCASGTVDIYTGW